MADVIQDYQRRLLSPHDIQGHMLFMQDTVASYEKPVVIELGTRTGNSTAAFLTGLSDNDGALWSMDIDEPDIPDYWYEFQNWYFMKCDDTLPMAQEWLPGKCDVLFIDTSHFLDHTLAELELYVPRVKPGGIVLMHDTQWKDPATDLGKPIGEVAQALDLYCWSAGLTWENRPGSYGMGVIKL